MDIETTLALQEVMRARKSFVKAVELSSRGEISGDDMESAHETYDEALEAFFAAMDDIEQAAL